MMLLNMTPSDKLQYVWEIHTQYFGHEFEQTLRDIVRGKWMWKFTQGKFEDKKLLIYFETAEDMAMAKLSVSADTIVANI